MGCYIRTEGEANERRFEIRRGLDDRVAFARANTDGRAGVLVAAVRDDPGAEILRGGPAPGVRGQGGLG